MDKELETIQKFTYVIIDFLTNYSFQILGAVIILIIGIFFSKYAYKFTIKITQKYNIDETISKFIANFIRFLIVAIMTMVALGKLGISIAPFIAAIGAISLTAGLALQGSVSNFAAGVVLILTKPFKVGDTITVHNVFGEVKDIKLSYTILENEDKEQITIPNKYMIGDVLVNSFSYRIVEGSIGVSYNSDTQIAINFIHQVLESFPELNKENKNIVGIQKFADSSIEIGYRYWVPTQKYFKTQYDVNQKILDIFKENNIDIPFPQREIKILTST